MNQEWYCTSKALAGIMIVLVLLQSTPSSKRKFAISSKQQWRDYLVRQYAGKRTE